MKKYTLYNRFHNTRATFIAPENSDGAFAAYMELNYLDDSKSPDDPERQWAHRKLRAIHHKLCPHSYGCACRGMIGG